MDFHETNDQGYASDSAVVHSDKLLDQTPDKNADDQDQIISHHDFRSGVVGDDDEDALSSLLMLAAQQPETPEHNSPVEPRNSIDLNQNIDEHDQSDMKDGVRNDNISEEDQQTAQILSSFKNNNTDNSLFETGKSSFSSEVVPAPIQVFPFLLFLFWIYLCLFISSFSPIFVFLAKA
jgi:hypothetical protein